MSLQTFRYAACGGGNTLLDICIYSFSYHFIYKKQDVHTPLVTISPHIAAMLTGLAITFPLGFYLSRAIVFTGASLRGRIQLFRDVLVVTICICLNYIFNKLFGEQCH